jgi:hypothetical protein
VPEPPDPLGLTSSATVAAEFERAGLPSAPGRDLIQKLCAGCHQPTVITRFRLPEQGWRSMVSDMVNRGMAGTPDQREVVINYLTAHLGPDRVQ